MIINSYYCIYHNYFSKLRLARLNMESAEFTLGLQPQRAILQRDLP
jgi:hypothetical protein